MITLHIAAANIVVVATFIPLEKEIPKTEQSYDIDNKDS
jgi:hypothetical protein